MSVIHHPGVKILWHANVGYSFDLGSPDSVSIQTGDNTRNWSTFGIPTHPPSNVDMFAARIEQPKDQTNFVTGLVPQNLPLKAHSAYRWENLVHRVDKSISAILDAKTGTAFIVFWAAGGDHPGLPT